MKQLTIDTSTSFFAAALIENNQAIAQRKFEVQRDHSSFAMPAIVELFTQAQWTLDDITEIIVTQGPGSYTGIRIGVTLAKTLAYAKNLPLVGVSTLHLLAANCEQEGVLIVPIIDAKRQEVFTGFYQYQNGEWLVREADRLQSVESLIEQLQVQPLPVVFVGKDVQLFPNLISAINGEVEPNIATDGVKLAQIAQQYERVTNLHQFAPNYYKLSQAEADLAKRKEQLKDGI
ncbi:MAG: tRNA (adenosine(37)-N6)-threonylcarbamoyltransferase complex dimerization subunit type 1 TsaB [Culicoidibacterales bacterium]